MSLLAEMGPMTMPHEEPRGTVISGSTDDTVINLVKLDVSFFVASIAACQFRSSILFLHRKKDHPLSSADYAITYMHGFPLISFVAKICLFDSYKYVQVS